MAVPNTFTPGSVISSAAVNANFSYLDNKATFSNLTVTIGTTTLPAIGITATNGSYPTVSFTDLSGSSAVAGGGNVLILRAGGITAAANKVYVLANGNVGIGAVNPSSRLTVVSDTMCLTTPKTPASATDTGTTGTMCWDANYVYVCVATNTWKRAALTTW